MHSPPQSFKLGIFYMLGAMFIFSVINAVVKNVIVDYSPIQLVFFRCFFACVPISLFLTLRGQWTLPSPFKWKIHLFRGILHALALPLIFLGVGTLPLSDSMALYFSSTLFLVVLSYPILREKVTSIQWLTVGIGLIGVIIISKPTSGIFHYGALFIIGGTLMESMYNLFGRILSTTHNSLIITFLGSLLPSLILLCILPFIWISPDLNGWIALLFLGIGGGLGQLCIVLAYHHAPPGILAPIIYSAILWSVLLDITFWGSWPTKSLILGCGIIIAAGLMIVGNFKGDVRIFIKPFQRRRANYR